LKFALNYSPEAAALIDEKCIDIDLYKCPDWDDLIATASQHRPVYIHFPLMTAYGREFDLDRVEKLRTQTQTPYINMHLGGRSSLFNVALDETNETYADHLQQVIIDDVNKLVAKFGSENIILENLPWDPVYEIPLIAIRPSFIRHIIETTDCGLLLDLAHARIAAARIKMDVFDYIAQLPLDRLRELHVTGVYDDSGYLRDHFPMTSEDWKLFEAAMEHIEAGKWRMPEIVACEYGGIGPMFEWRSKREVIAAEIPRMFNAVHAINAETKIT
jgi:uncharacterized protein